MGITGKESELAALIKSEKKSAGFNVDNENCLAGAEAEALAQAIISFLVDNIEVQTDVIGGCPSGGGPLTSGKGVGTIK